jgi:aldose 1-epimerase
MNKNSIWLSFIFIWLSTYCIADDLKVKKSSYGKMPDGAQVEEYILSNDSGMTVRLISFGARVTSVEVPDRDGNSQNITLGFDNLDDYIKHTAHFGCTVGRFANRIAKGKFVLDGKHYQLNLNNGANHLHGGYQSFDQFVWKSQIVRKAQEVGVQFTHVSEDGEENYPGKLTTIVTYSINQDNELTMDYKATTDAPTILNLTNHCYWNLTGNPENTILDHELLLYADQYLLVTPEVIPTGKIVSVKGTPMDFNKMTRIGLRFPELLKAGLDGYGYCYVIRKQKKKLSKAATLHDPKSGRVMEISTTQPGIQFYTGNKLSGEEKNGGFKQYSAFCLESEHYPDSPNHPHFPSTVLRPGDQFHEITVHRFSVKSK